MADVLTFLGITAVSVAYYFIDRWQEWNHVRRVRNSFRIMPDRVTPDDGKV